MLGGNIAAKLQRIADDHVGSPGLQQRDNVIGQARPQRLNETIDLLRTYGRIFRFDDLPIGQCLKDAIRFATQIESARKMPQAHVLHGRTETLSRGKGDFVTLFFQRQRQRHQRVKVAEERLDGKEKFHVVADSLRTSF